MKHMSQSSNHPKPLGKITCFKPPASYSCFKICIQKLRHPWFLNGAAPAPSTRWMTWAAWANFPTLSLALQSSSALGGCKVVKKTMSLQRFGGWWWLMMKDGWLIYRWVNDEWWLMNGLTIELTFMVTDGEWWLVSDGTATEWLIEFSHCNWWFLMATLYSYFTSLNKRKTWKLSNWAKLWTVEQHSTWFTLW